MKKVVLAGAALLLALTVTTPAGAGGFGATRRPLILAAKPGATVKQYQGVSGTSNGKPMSAAVMNKAQLNTDGTNFAMQLGGKLLKGTYKLDKSKKVKQVDAIPNGGGAPIKGIYKVNGDTMTVCYAAPGKARPTSFSARPGSGQKLLVWKKVK
jgi:uncharacterized protein (TIGR03067 family)